VAVVGPNDQPGTKNHLINTADVHGTKLPPDGPRGTDYRFVIIML
jgi:hypothetical protein